MANVNLSTVVPERVANIINWASNQCGTTKSEFIKALIYHEIDLMCLEKKFDDYQKKIDNEYKNNIH